MSNSSRKPSNRSDRDDPNTVSSTVDVDLEFPWRSPPELDFDDVGGFDEIKEEIRRTVVRPLGPKYEEYRRFGVTVPNLLFTGPPGTGKSYTAKALAGELGYPFVILTTGRLQSKWINESSNQVQRLFREAATLADQHGHAVIFADEIDSVLPARTNTDKHHEDSKVVTEFLAFLERTASNDTLFIGATNCRDQLDPAAIRNGRIDRELRFGLPDTSTRGAILRQQLSGRPSDVTSAEMSTVAKETEGATAADLEKLVDEAARYAVENDDSAITSNRLHQVLRRIQ